MGTRARVVWWVVFLLFDLFCLIKNYKPVAISQEAASCAQEFDANACASPIPYLKEQCGLWKVCMESDASHVMKTRVIVRLVSEVLSEFVEGFFGRLSLKTCVSVDFTTCGIVKLFPGLFHLYFCIQELGKSCLDFNITILIL